MSKAETPPAWYPDPRDRRAQRYWDGGAWTEHVVDSAGRPLVDPVGTAYPPVPTADELQQQAEHRARVRKRTRIELVVLLPFMLLLVVTPVLFRQWIRHQFVVEPGRRHHVIYEIAGSAPSVRVTTETGDGPTEQTNALVPPRAGWAEIKLTTDSYELLYVAVRNRTVEGSVSCRIRVDGKIVTHHSSDRPFGIARCDAST